MNGRLRFLRLLAVVLAVASVPVSAVVWDGFQFVFDFAHAASSAGATWSGSLERTPGGLRAAAERQPFWVELPPIAIGPAHRPPTSTSVEAAVACDGAYLSLNAFVRYSTDHVHWSPWYGLKAKWENMYEPRGEFTGEVSTSAAARLAYDSLRDAWWKTNPAWPNDETELCLWLAANHPDDFAAAIPLVGYLQLRVEGVSRENLSLKSVKLSGNYAVSGINFMESAKPRRDSENMWFFDLSAARRSTK